MKLEIENLNLHYGSFQALKNINIGIHEKEITAFIGVNLAVFNLLLHLLNITLCQLVMHQLNSFILSHARWKGYPDTQTKFNLSKLSLFLI